MAQIEYITVKINAFMGAHLRDYEYSPDKSHSVNRDEKIGQKMKNGFSLHVIVPLVYSKDGKWLQAINENGLTGFIRASHIDLKEMAKNKPEKLDKPFMYFTSAEERIVYEAENGLRKYSPELIENAKNTIAQWEKDSIDGEEWVKQYERETGEKISKARLVSDLEYVDKIVNHFRPRKGIRPKIDQYRIKLDKDRPVNRLTEVGFPSSIDKKTGRIQTTATIQDLTAYGINTLNRFDWKHYVHPDSYNGFRMDDEDKRTFVVGNRAYAEKAAEERLKYKQEIEMMHHEQASFHVPKSLTSDQEEKYGHEERLYIESGLKDFFTKQVTAHGGFLVGEVHTKPKTKEWITQNIASMKAAGVNTIYIEHIMSESDQKLVDRFFHNDGNKMDRELENFCRSNFGMKELLEEAKMHKMRVIGLGSRFAQADTVNDPYTRALLFNQHAAAQIKTDQKALPEDQKGYIVLAGTAHMCMHQGREYSKPIHGLSQLLEMHTVELDHENKLVLKDPNLIYTRTTVVEHGEKKEHGEFVTIDKYCKANGIKKSTERVDFHTLENQGKNRNSGKRSSGTTAKTVKEPTKNKELDLGFTTISEEEIKEVNQRVKKPVIGGRRGLKK